jgi:hypothetical protein
MDGIAFPGVKKIEYGVASGGFISAQVERIVLQYPGLSQKDSYQQLYDSLCIVDTGDFVHTIRMGLVLK